MFLARVYVTLKPAVNDPQGLAILGALHNLSYTSVSSIRAGRRERTNMERAEP